MIICIGGKANRGTFFQNINLFQAAAQWLADGDRLRPTLALLITLPPLRVEALVAERHFRQDLGPCNERKH
jgi:hypothetical protein